MKASQCCVMYLLHSESLILPKRSLPNSKFFNLASTDKSPKLNTGDVVMSVYLPVVEEKP